MKKVELVMDFVLIPLIIGLVAATLFVPAVNFLISAAGFGYRFDFLTFFASAVAGSIFTNVVRWAKGRVLPSD